jgi:hypothetical protein
MSAPVIVLFCIGMAAIFWSACFIGCLSEPSRPVSTYYEYQKTVTTTTGLIAFWPLNDTSGTVAAELAQNHLNGTYTVGAVVASYNAAAQSDASPGTFTLGQPNIVTGDTVGNNPHAPNPCVFFDGGFVNVPGQPALGSPQFTLEAWVKPNWTSLDAQNNPSYRAVVVSADVATFSGFALLATPGNLWSFQIGNGSQYVPVMTGNNQTIVQGSLYFLVVTYDGSTVTLWVNPADTSQAPDGTATAGGYTPVPTSIPFFIGEGRPDLPTPLFPFNGWIQDVAFYDVVLDGKTIETHYANGLGMKIG